MGCEMIKIGDLKSGEAVFLDENDFWIEKDQRHLLLATAEELEEIRTRRLCPPWNTPGEFVVMKHSGCLFVQREVGSLRV